MRGSATGRFQPLWMVAIAAAILLLAGCAAQGGASVTPRPATAPSQASAANPSPAANDTRAAGEATAPAESATAASTGATATSAGAVASPTAARSGDATQLAPTGVATAAPSATAGAQTSPTGAAATAATAPNFDALGLAVAPLAQGLSSPLYVTHAGDGSGRLFVVEKTGAIRIIQGGKLLDRPFLDIGDRVTSSGSEQGFLGLAFPPDYVHRKFFFVDYIDNNGNTMIARYKVTADPNVADPGSEEAVLTIDQPASNHNGGDLVFGPDGYLWIGTGDGGGENDQFGTGQNPNTLLAKMLRIDVTSDASKPYLVPKDNPNAAQQWKAPPEAWAMGLRNPWRYSFDPATGDLWIGDVGQNQIEEVDVVRAGSKGGLNFGWSIMEGPSCFQAANCNQNGLVLPVASYRHGADGCSITGGYVYRGNQFPALQGVYLYGDYCSGRIWGLEAANPGQPKLLLETGPGLSSFGEDQAGEIYITNLGDGTVRQIVVK